MKTTNIQTSDKTETRVALTFITVLFFSLLIASNIMAAPTKFEGYTADCNNQRAIIKWNVSNDTTNIHYTVERTQDGVHYELITDVQAIAGSEMHEYSAIDGNPLNGMAYYRISEITESGKKEYLNTVVYTPCENQEAIDAFTIGSYIFIQVNSTSTDSCSIIIKNHDSKILYSKVRKVSVGMNNIKISPELEDGICVLYVRCNKMKLNKILFSESDEK